MKIINAVGILVVLLMAGCAEGSDEMAETGPRSVDGKGDSLAGTFGSYEEFRSSLYCEPDDGPCIVQGDIPIWGEEALQNYYAERAGLLNGLTVMRVDAVDAVWSRNERYDLTYCISDDFGERKGEVAEAFIGAVSEWEEIADIDLRYVPEHDARCNNRNVQVVFNVSPTRDRFASYIARAFFPSNKERSRREVLINFDSHDRLAQNPDIEGDYTLQGVLRHEIGHVLGFRHEHIRDEANAFFCREDDDFRPLTEYDASSVMHYPQCNGEGDWGLHLTDVDGRGAAFFYPDFDDFTAARCDVELDDNGTINEACQPVVHQILELANTGSFEVLDDWVRLDVRAVEEMVAQRETRPFNTLDELREIRYFADVGIAKMYNYLYVDGRCPIEIDDNGLVNAQCRPVVNRILALVNEAELEYLDHIVRLDSRAAANIVVIREQRPFTSFAELWDVDYVKTRAFGKMYHHLYEDESR